MMVEIFILLFFHVWFVETVRGLRYFVNLALKGISCTVVQHCCLLMQFYDLSYCSREYCAIYSEQIPVYALIFPPYPPLPPH